MLGGSEGTLPQEMLKIRCSEIASEATFGPKRHYSYLYVFACMTLICIDIHMPCRSVNIRGVCGSSVITPYTTSMSSSVFETGCVLRVKDNALSSRSLFTV